ncbi:cyclin-dependent kinase inhibitor 7 isoform X4 [Helianthus annuus]|uniref:cyclin-dependent kinase inhibitor 7 isoform X4 n=1 Tax=Helianthus annuus TaxID=4232 RepID=UPI000B8FCD9F|nr:cyclin-dependent kinase inhibitor 7 isoform X4 [Helianthus annuus]
MIDITVTTGCNCRLQIPPMEPSLSHGTVRRSTFSDITTSGTGKRRRLDRQDEYNHFQLQYQYQRDVDVNLLENVASSFMCSVNDDLITDLKAECVSGTESFMSVPDGFSRNTSASSVICLETEETESVSTSKSNNNKKKKTTPATGTVTVAVAEDEATSRRKPPAPAAIMPCAAEIEEFFSKAEKYEQKRFVEKYNYDIVKDVPMEGRYQWIELKP